jgi:hypothetical protein
MKRILSTAIIAILFSSLAGANLAWAEIFWDRSKPASVDITDKDFKYKYGSSESKSLGDMEVYDERKAVTPEASVEPEPQPAQDVAPIAPIVPEPRRVKPTGGATVVKPKEPVAGASDQKKEVLPSAPQTQGEPEQRVNQATSTMESSRPATKKMPWGTGAQKEEPKTTETTSQLQFEDKPKYRWGQ